MKTFITFITLLLTLHMTAQDPMLQKNNEVLEAIAVKITKSYDDQLSLDAKQFVLFQKKIEEYLIREEKIHNSYTGEKKLSLLNELRTAETMEMRNVLTQPQYNLYRRIKPQIQPLAVVKTDK